MRIHIFRTGTHTDSEGRTKEWTEADLDRIVTAYNAHLAAHPNDDAPLAIGHPKGSSAPAFGWVKSLIRDGENLFAEIKPTVNEFVEWIKKGLYKKISMAVDPKTFLLKHIAFLGATPPAVKGLEAVQFDEGEMLKVEYEFQEKIEMEDEMEKKNLDELEQEITKLNTQISEFAEKNKGKEKEVDELKVELSAVREAYQRMEYLTFCDELIREGKLTPHQAAFSVDFMVIASGAGDYEFSEPSEKEDEEPKTVKKPVLLAFKEFLKTLPKQVEFEEFATKVKAKTKEGEDEAIVRQIASASPGAKE